jgi:hypothetical protein
MMYESVCLVGFVRILFVHVKAFSGFASLAFPIYRRKNIFLNFVWPFYNDIASQVCCNSELK